MEAQKDELHRLLSTLLLAELAIDEKLGIIRTEYDIPVDDKLRKDMSAMCNLSCLAQANQQTQGILAFLQ